MAKNSNGGCGCALIVLGIFGLSVFTKGWHDSSPSSSTATSHSADNKAIEAWVMAQSFVKKSLKSPGTADFGGLFSDHQYPRDCVTPLGDNRYRVQGWVDSQNGFGATIRTRFELTVEDLGGAKETWRLTEGPDFRDW